MSQTGEDQERCSVGLGPECFEGPVESGGRVGLRTTRRDEDQHPGAGDDQAFGDVAHHGQSSHQVAGGAFEVVEKGAAGSLVDVIPAYRDDDDAGGDECDRAGAGLDQACAEPRILCTGGFPGAAGESERGYANAK
jgi:hypothetical protein